MFLFRVSYRDDSGDSPVFSHTLWGYDAEHVYNRFHDTIDADGWVFVGATKVVAS